MASTFLEADVILYILLLFEANHTFVSRCNHSKFSMYTCIASGNCTVNLKTSPQVAEELGQHYDLTL